MFDDVLVLLDGSTDSARAIGPAAAIARYLDTTLRAVGFYEGPSSHYLSSTIGEQIRRWGDLKAEITIQPLIGSVAASLAEVLADHKAFMVCMSTHGRGRSAALVGSETSDVLEVAPSPVLLVGPRRVGKTTVLQLLLRLYDVDSGKVRIDGRDVRQIRTRHLRSLISFAPQEPFLYAGTIRENITFGNPAISDAKLAQAIRLAAKMLPGEVLPGSDGLTAARLLTMVQATM